MFYLSKKKKINVLMALKDSQIIKYCANNFTFSDKKNF